MYTLLHTFTGKTLDEFPQRNTEREKKKNLLEMHDSLLPLTHDYCAQNIWSYNPNMNSWPDETPHGSVRAKGCHAQAFPVLL